MDRLAVAAANLRALRLYVTNPATRQAIKKQFAVPPEVFHYLGYGLFIGRK